MRDNAFLREENKANSSKEKLTLQRQLSFHFDLGVSSEWRANVIGWFRRFPEAVPISVEETTVVSIFR